MKKNLFLLLIMIGSIKASAQISFPEKCIGKWKGNMHIYSKGQLRDSVTVVLTVQPLDSSSWSWKMEYLSETMPVTKDYVLRCTDKLKNKYVTDERDGTILNESVFGNKCFSIFETDGIWLTSRYEWLNAEELSFEVTSSRASGNDGSALKNYDMSVLQSVVFKRLN